jgi:hypothetical protein
VKYGAPEKKTRQKADNGGDYRKFEGSERGARGQNSVTKASLVAAI